MIETIMEVICDAAGELSIVNTGELLTADTFSLVTSPIIPSLPSPPEVPEVPPEGMIDWEVVLPWAVGIGLVSIPLIAGWRLVDENGTVPPSLGF